jgi:chitinase
MNRAFVGDLESVDSEEVSYTPPIIDDSDDAPAISHDEYTDDDSEYADADCDDTGNLQDVDDNGMSDEWEYEVETDPADTAANIVPDRPEIAAVDATERVGLTPVLVSGTYFDPDNDDHHLSQWQISTESNFASLIMDLTTQYHLTAFTVGEMVLDADTRYYWRVRYIDSRDGQSSWSQPSNFTTLTADQTDDSNADGIPDAQAVDQAVDLNRNGVPDILEANMMSVNTVEGQSVVSIQGMSDDFSLVSLKSLPSDAISDQSVKLEFGLIGFKIYLQEGVNTATLNVYFSEPLEDGADPYKYSADTGWTIYEDVIFSPDRKRVTLTLVDGGNGDEDGVENGVIVDPFGIAQTDTESAAPDNASLATGPPASAASGINGCFISAATGQGIGGQQIRQIAAFIMMMCVFPVGALLVQKIKAVRAR